MQITQIPKIVFKDKIKKTNYQNENALTCTVNVHNTGAMQIYSIHHSTMYHWIQSTLMVQSKVTFIRNRSLKTAPLWSVLDNTIGIQ